MPMRLWSTVVSHDVTLPRRQSARYGWTCWTSTAIRSTPARCELLCVEDEGVDLLVRPVDAHHPPSPPPPVGAICLVGGGGGSFSLPSEPPPRGGIGPARSRGKTGGPPGWESGASRGGRGRVWRGRSLWLFGQTPRHSSRT